MMDKLTLYEIFSYLVPGYFLLYFADYFSTNVLGCFPFLDIQDSVEKNIFNLLLAIFLGISFHMVSFFFKEKKIIKKLIYQEVDDYVNKKEDLQNIREFIKTYLQKNSFTISDYFDVAYYYLEVNDKITFAKNFQSIYFLLRNVFSIGLVLLVLQLVICGFSFFGWYSYDWYAAVWYFLFTLFLLFVLIKPAQFYRGKMIDRILWSYYSILKSK